MRGLGEVKVSSARTLSDEDFYAKNTLTDRERVDLADNESVAVDDGLVTITLPPVSWTVLALE